MKKTKQNSHIIPLPLFDTNSPGHTTQNHPTPFSLVDGEEGIIQPLVDPRHTPVYQEMTPPLLLAHLNDPQRRAVTTTQIPLLIVAGPGSGKTRVITHRIAYLIQQEHVPPKHLLAMTFTNRAAVEMKERLERMVGQHTRCFALLFSAK
ncbi:hypothetical protein KSF_109650 [Reticulibacter mediterranei]|uniref:UvrD-like helicase ATP-binding domain-containing protein n=1 Tax=Reticulibacter mediterranei TaxID=2778369 RepID=A0A8J3J220_9CHLR|nr:UvrD-helicase domain-containing protein [Reticulibacter mediterranei]GHP00918.1 hypothetical protein KSF_109650 [Reticulibacter mediterranei]